MCLEDTCILHEYKKKGQMIYLIFLVWFGLVRKILIIARSHGNPYVELHENRENINFIFGIDRKSFIFTLYYVLHHL